MIYVTMVSPIRLKMAEAVHPSLLTNFFVISEQGNMITREGEKQKFPYPLQIYFVPYLCHFCAILGLKMVENDGIGLKQKLI